MNFYDGLGAFTLEALLERFVAASPEGEAYARGYYAEVAYAIAKRGPRGAAILQGQLDTADTPRLAAILFALTGPDSATPLPPERLFTYLEDDRPQIVAEAVDGLSRLGTVQARIRVLGLRQHPSPYVRGSVLRFMRQVDGEGALSLLIDTLRDEHFIVREMARPGIG